MTVGESTATLQGWSRKPTYLRYSTEGWCSRRTDTSIMRFSRGEPSSAVSTSPAAVLPKSTGYLEPAMLLSTWMRRTEALSARDWSLQSATRALTPSTAR